MSPCDQQTRRADAAAYCIQHPSLKQPHMTAARSAAAVPAAERLCDVSAEISSRLCPPMRLATPSRGIEHRGTSLLPRLAKRSQRQVQSCIQYAYFTQLLSMHTAHG